MTGHALNRIMPDFPSPTFLKILVGLAAVIIVFIALDAAQSLLSPILAAIVVGVVFGPFTDFVERRRLPRAAAAFLVLMSLGFIVGLLFVGIEPTVSYAIANAPIIWAEMRDIVGFVRDAISGVQELQEQVADALVAEEVADGDGADSQVEVPNIMDALAYGPSVLAGFLVFAGTLYFFLATRLASYEAIARLFPGASVECLTEAERQVSRYFLTITIVNASFGFVFMLIMSVIGMPQPALWGLAVFLLNFVLYLGPICVAVALLITGIVTFDGAMSFVPAACFVGLNMIEAQFVTPSFIGRQMSINPLLVFLSLVLWLWLWGPVGGLIAIPTLVWVLFVFGDRPAAAPTDKLGNATP